MKPEIIKKSIDKIVKSTRNLVKTGKTKTQSSSSKPAR